MPTATTYFPDVYVLPNYRRQTIHATIVEESFGKPQKMALLPADGRERFTFNTMHMRPADNAALRAFLRTQRGSFGTFYFFAKDEDKHTGLVIIPAYDAGGSLPLVLPFRESVITQVYDDGVPVTSFVFSAGTGPGGEDRITSILGVPADDSVITADITGRGRFIVRQDSDVEDKSFLEQADDYGSFAVALIQEL